MSESIAKRARTSEEESNDMMPNENELMDNIDDEEAAFDDDEAPPGSDEHDDPSAQHDEEDTQPTMAANRTTVVVGGGGGGGKSHAPSKVVHIRNLNDTVTEADVKRDLSRFGHINKTLFMYKKRQALVEYDDLQSAVKCVTEAAKFNVRIGGSPAYINYSPYNNLTKHEDREPPQTFENRNEDNPVLFFSIHDAQYPINVDVMNAICAPFGNVLRIVIFRKNGVQSMVEFETPEAAKHAKEELDDADIYNGCCTLQIEYAKIRSLNVPRNDQDTWDFTQPDLGSNKGSYDSENGSYSNYKSSNYNSESSSGGGGKEIPSLMGSTAQPTGNPPTTSILMVNNLCSSKFNCDRLFNLLCLYGNVDRIKFLLTKEGSAIAQMSNSDPILNCLAHLNNTYAFGRKLQINVNNQCIFKPVAKPAPLADGTPSYKDYTNSRANRYQTPDAAKRNNPVPPSNVLHWFNAPPGYEQDQILDLFKNAGSKPPVKIKVFVKKTEKATTGLVEWNNIGDCTEALILTNNIEINHPSSKYPYIFKLCYSSTPIIDPN